MFDKYPLMWNSNMCSLERSEFNTNRMTVFALEKFLDVLTSNKNLSLNSIVVISDETCKDSHRFSSQ